MPYELRPQDETIMGALHREFDWQQAIENVGGYRSENALTVPGLNTDNLLDGVLDLLDTVNPIYWQSTEPGSLYGMGLVYDPENGTPYSDTFGDPYYQQYSKEDYFTAVDKDVAQYISGGYMDSLRFNTLCPAVRENAVLNQLMNRFKVPYCRSTLRILDGRKVRPNIGDGGYHVDENPFEFLRINICLSTNRFFGLQYKGEEPFFLKPGEHAVIMTHKMHRAFIVGPSYCQRIHLVINVAPWLDFNKETGEWRPNKFFGVKHPFDMVKDGDIYV